jgi:cytochrome P450
MSARQRTDYVYDRVEMLFQPEIVLDRIRADGDVVWSETMRRWLVLSKAAAADVLRNPKFRVYDLIRAFRSLQARTGVDLADLARVCAWIPFLHDGARHVVLRALFARILADLRGEYLEAFTAASRSLLEAMVANGGGDLARDYGERLHSEAIGEIAGFDPADRIWIAAISSSRGAVDFAASLSEMADANRRTGTLLRRLEVLAQGNRTNAFMNRLGGHLAACGIEDTRVNRLECLSALILLGRDTLAGTLTVGLVHMLDSNDGRLTPDDWGRPAEIVDEFIRLSSTVQIAIRVAEEPIEIAGQTIATSETAMVFLPAANRDPAAYTCPHAMKASHGPHIAFGASRHLCVGMTLSRAAVEIALNHLSALGTIRSLSGRQLDQTRNTRKFTSLPVGLSPNV